MTVFECEDYKNFLRAQIEDNRQRRGYRSELAKAAGCQLSFLSQVLHSHVQLTPDHAAGLCIFWGFDTDERDYFIELVGLARASSKALRSVLSNRLEEIRERHQDLASRYRKEAAMMPAYQALYYSSWHISAIHVLVTIPELRTVEAISARLSLPQDMVREALEQLARIGLIAKQGPHWMPTQTDIHLPKDSVLTSMNHSNWRARAVQDSYQPEKGSIHYTAVHSVSRPDCEKIKEMVLRFLDETRAVVGPSREEELACLTLDWFVV